MNSFLLRTENSIPLAHIFFSDLNLIQVIEIRDTDSKYKLNIWTCNWFKGCFSKASWYQYLNMVNTRLSVGLMIDITQHIVLYSFYGSFWILTIK